MSSESSTATAKKPATGKQIAFSLVGDDLHLYETVREIYEDESQEDERKVADALAQLDPSVRSLVQARFVPSPKKDLSHRQVFVRALQEVLDARDAAEDARVAAEEPANSENEVEVAA